MKDPKTTPATERNERPERAPSEQEPMSRGAFSGSPGGFGGGQPSAPYSGSYGAEFRGDYRAERSRDAHFRTGPERYQDNSDELGSNYGGLSHGSGHAGDRQDRDRPDASDGSRPAGAADDASAKPGDPAGPPPLLPRKLPPKG